jgi:murein DD-endopeptidase MepM/ murein hydrolase activator NlpD
MSRMLALLLCLACALQLVACATTHANIADYADGPLKRKGVLHPVEKGQTLYRIARTYNVPVQELAEVNDLSDPTKLAVGQALWIPGAEKVLAVSMNATPAPTKPRAKARAVPARQATSSAPPASTPPATTTATAPPAPAKVAPAEPESDPDPPPPPPPEDEPKVQVAHSRFIWPVKGGVVGSRFGVRDGTQHDGIDIDAPKGTAIVAADAGEVLYVGNQKGYGNLVLVRHSDNLITVYAHNDANNVAAGDHVKQGQELAVVGQTGNATGPHCHFEVRQDRLPRNPLFFLP